MTWEVVKLNQILFQVKDKFDVKNDMDYSQITVSNTGVVSLRGVQKGFNIGTKKQTIAHKGQFIYSRLGVHQGSFGIVPKELDGAIVTGDMPIFEIDREKIYPNFLIYCLKLPSFKKKLTDLTRGLAQSRVREKFFLDIDIKIPSLDEQKVLLNKLDSLNISMNVLLKNNLKNESYISWLRQAILSDAVTGRLVPQDPNDEPAEKLLDKIKAEKEKLIKEGKLKKDTQLSSTDEPFFELPSGWTQCKLLNVCLLITDGKHGDCQNKKDSGYYFLSAKDIQNGNLIYENAREITYEDFMETHRRTNLEPGDICIVNTGATVGKIAIAPDNSKTQKSTFQKSVAVVKPIKELINNKYIEIILRAKAQKLLKLSGGSAINNLLLSDMKNLSIGIPPLNEQKRIVEKVESLMKICDELEKNIQETKENVSKLNEAILREMFN